MTTPIEPNVLKIYAKRLTIGMWVTKIDGSRAQVIPQTGVRLQDAEQLQMLKEICHIATIDLARCDQSAVESMNTGTVDDLGMVEDIKLMELQHQVSANTLLRQPLIDTQRDRHGFQGRLVARVLAASLVDFFRTNQVNSVELQQQLSDYVAYTQINPDRLLLESQLSTNQYNSVGIAMRALVHGSLYCFAVGKTTPYVEQYAMTQVLYALLMHKAPTELTKKGLQAQPIDSALLQNSSEALQVQVLKQLSLPMAVKKALPQVFEYFDGSGPTGLRGKKIVTTAQLCSLAFWFEAQQSLFVSKPMSAAKTTTRLRELTLSRFCPQLINQIVQILPMFPTGSVVKLAPMQQAVVVAQHAFRKLAPDLLALTDVRGVPLTQSYQIEDEFGMGIKQLVHQSAWPYETLIRAKLQVQLPWYTRFIPRSMAHWWHEIREDGLSRLTG